MNAGSPITQSTLEAVRSSADVVLTSMERGIDGDRVAFSLCTRTPCCSRVHGGYCFLNNSAIAAERCLRRGAKRVAILDVDYHPGNGTQIIIYDRNDVFFTSINGIPMCYTPTYQDLQLKEGQRGSGLQCKLPTAKGHLLRGFCIPLQTHPNVSMPTADFLVISLSVDTFEHDAISHFRLTSENFIQMGQAIAKPLSLPSL